MVAVHSQEFQPEFGSMLQATHRFGNLSVLEESPYAPWKEDFPFGRSGVPRYSLPNGARCQQHVQCKRNDPDVIPEGKVGGFCCPFMKRCIESGFGVNTQVHAIANCQPICRTSDFSLCLDSNCRPKDGTPIEEWGVRTCQVVDGVEEKPHCKEKHCPEFKELACKPEKRHVPYSYNSKGE